jgi:hypothetical protein
MKAPELAIAVAIAAAVACGTAFGEDSRTASAGPVVKSELAQPDVYAPVAFSSEDSAEESSAEGIDESCSCDSCNSCNTCCSNGWDFGGWIQQGITFNGYDPEDGFNGPIGLNDRANEYQMNQLWLYAERKADTGGCGLDYGGRVDVVYGTDGQFFQMIDGLEDRWDQTNRFYQVALLRFYADVAWDDLTVRMGRFDAPVGYEPFEATESFFYSKSYTFMTQPGSVFGMMATQKLNDQFSVSAGMHRGADQFDDTDGKDAVDFMGGGAWQSCDTDTWLDAYVIAQESGPGTRALDYSVIGGTMLTEDLEYVFEWYYGNYNEVVQEEWYGLNQHFIYTLNDCWAAGTRFEWFRDDDGDVVRGFRDGNAAQGPYVGDFYELTFAVNYTPRENLAIRPEIRWDWYKGDDPNDPVPFDVETRSNQFIASIDVVYAF